MKRTRRLRRLVPDPELVRRRASGETLRELAADYGVAHTTLGRYFARPEVARQVREAGPSARRERRAAAAARQAAQRLAERELRSLAKEQVALARGLEAAGAKLAAGQSLRRRSAYEAWLDEHDARQPLTRADLRTRSDELAAGAVAAGGGLPAVIEATGLRTRENVLRSIDRVVVVGALGNDAAAAAGERLPEGLRRLVPDPELVRRRAAGESLRRIAIDYGVAHTTLCRYFQRRDVARQLRAPIRHRPPAGARAAPASPLTD